MRSTSWNEFLSELPQLKPITTVAEAFERKDYYVNAIANLRERQAKHSKSVKR